MVRIQKIAAVSLLAASLFLTGCMSKNEINADFRKIDQAWRAENSQIAGNHLNREVPVGQDIAFQSVKKSFTDLGMNIVNTSTAKGYIITRNPAPTPLSPEQWEHVREVENPKLQELVGWMYSLESDPSDYHVIVKATVTENTSDSSDVQFEISLEMPKYENMGFKPSKEIPPQAFTLASEKIWSQVQKNIQVSLNDK